MTQGRKRGEEDGKEEIGKEEERERGGEKVQNSQGVHCSSRKQTVAVLPISAGISSKLFSPALRCCRFTSNLWEGGREGREGGRRKEGVYDNQYSSQKVTVH